MTTGQVITEKNTQNENATDSIEGIEMVDLTTNVQQVFQKAPPSLWKKQLLIK